MDEFGFTLVDFTKMAHKSYSFILASQAKQVFYVQNLLDPNGQFFCQLLKKTSSIESVKPQPA